MTAMIHMAFLLLAVLVAVAIAARKLDVPPSILLVAGRRRACADTRPAARRSRFRSWSFWGLASPADLFGGRGK